MRFCKGLFLLFALITAHSSPLLASDPRDPQPFRKAEAMQALRGLRNRETLAPEPTPNQLLYDVIHYELEVGIEPVSHFVEGRVSMKAISRTEVLSSVDVDADTALTIESVNDGGEYPLEWTRTEKIVSISLAGSISAGDTFCLEIHYSGNPSTSADPGLFFAQAGGQPVIFSLSEPWSARSWWPCKDYPDDKATFDLYFSVPAILTATSNGRLIATNYETKWGQPYRRWHWREHFPMATYLASITAAVYVQLNDEFHTASGDTMPVVHYVYPWLESKARIDFSIAVPGLEFFSEIFGLYPFVSEKFGAALCSLDGGMEHQTLTSYGSDLVRGDHYYDWVYIHELTHQWFGDLITCKNWVHIWLNEGFASYAEALWFEHLEGKTRLRTYMESQDHPGAWHGPILREPDNPDPNYYFDNVVYDKAAWVLHMLRHIMGDDIFFAALRDYCADPRYRYKAAETADFVAICEARCGYSLDWFFDPWLTRTDRLAYRWSYSAYERWDGVNLTITVDQLQDSLYSMPVDFRVSTSISVIDTVLWIDERHEEFHIILPFGTLVQTVSMDPDHWILCDKTSASTSTPTPEMVVRLDQNFPNPFNPSTRIRFMLASAGKIDLRAYDMTGALRSILVSGSYEAGEYEFYWDGRDRAEELLPSGIYILRLTSSGRSVSRKVVILR